MDKKPLIIDYLFDATINRNSFSIEDIADMIQIMYEKKVVRQIEARKRISKII
jgi:hypothetical protein